MRMIFDAFVNVDHTRILPLFPYHIDIVQLLICSHFSCCTNDYIIHMLHDNLLTMPYELNAGGR